MTQTLDQPAVSPVVETATPAPDAAPAGTPRRGRRRAGAARAIRTLGASAGLLAALAAVAACAAYLTFPHLMPFTFIHHRYPKAAALVPFFAVGAVIMAIAAWRAAARLLRKTKGADAMTAIAAIVATGVSATGMWQFFAVYVPSVPVVLRIPLFAFLELTTLAEGLRARDNMRDFGSSGIDGTAMWAAAIIGGLLASLASTSIAEAIFRLVPPLGAAWLWERALVSERRRNPERNRDKDRKITWRISPDRILVRFGLAEPAGRTLGQAAAQRRITLLALASEAAANAQSLPADDRARRRADARLRRALRKAVEQTDLATSAELQRSLWAQIGALRNATDLVTGETTAPWHPVARRRRTEDRHDDQDRRDDDRKDQKDSQDRHDDRRQDGGDGGADSASPLGVLAARLTPAVRQQDAQLVHRILSSPVDYAALVQHLGASELFGAKRIMAMVAIYAQPAVAETANRNATWAAWVADKVPGDAGKIDRAEFRRMLELIAPVWTAGGYPSSDSDADDTELEQKAG